MAFALDRGLGPGVHSGPFGPHTDPDCFFLWNEAGFSPPSHSQTLGKLCELLVKSGISAGQAQQHTHMA